METNTKKILSIVDSEHTAQQYRYRELLGFLKDGTIKGRLDNIYDILSNVYRRMP